MSPREVEARRYRRMLQAMQESVHVKLEIAARHTETILRIVDLLVSAFRAGKKVVIFGNGGSAADAQHVAAEFVNRFLMERSALPAVALTTDTSNLTAIGNDYRFEEVFARQVKALVQPGDVVVGISTSGNSEDVLQGLRAARQRGARTVGFTGSHGGMLKDLVDVCFQAPSNSTPRIQEAHITVWHIVCELVEAELFESRRWAVFFDRDGTLNREVNYLGDPNQLELLPDAAEAVRRVRDAGGLAILVTNQAGVARGYFSERDVQAVHAALQRALAQQADTRLDGVYYCPHHPTAGRGPYRKDCPNRKPRPGMLLEAQRDFNLDLGRSFMVGDKLSDILAGHAAGVKTVLVLTGYGRRTLKQLAQAPVQPDFVARDVAEAVDWILRNLPVSVEEALPLSAARPAAIPAQEEADEQLSRR